MGVWVEEKWFIDLVNKYILNAHYEPGSILETVFVVVGQIEMIPGFTEHRIQKMEQAINRDK